MSGSEALISFAAALLFTVTLGNTGASAAECPAPVQATAVVAEVVDGDTLRLADGAVVRLADIEAPAPLLGASAGATWSLGEAAAAELRRLVGSGQIGISQSTDAPDRYGRRHAQAFLPDGRSLAAELVAGGFVRVHWLPGETACLGPLLAAERLARKARAGIWASSDYAVRSAQDH